MALSLVKPSGRPAGLPVFRAFVLVPLPEGSEGHWLQFKVAAVSATDACLKAAYSAVRAGFVNRGDSVSTIAETTAASCADHPWTRAERIVTPPGRTGGAK